LAGASATVTLSLLLPTLFSAAVLDWNSIMVFFEL
jgi:hypothetical protein